MRETKDIRDLQNEIEELRRTLNETTRALNYITWYLAEQSRLMAEHWYRFILWVRPFQLAAYLKPATIRRLRRPDSPPMLPPEDNSHADWDHPAKIDAAYLRRY